jgi:ubiquinone biosynthesis monooxygenase Coq7
MQKAPIMSSNVSSPSSSSSSSSSSFGSSSPSGFRRMSPLDRLLAEADRALRVLSGSTSGTRPNPAAALRKPAAPVVVATEPLAVVGAPDPVGTDDAAPSGELTPADMRHAAGLMRVNHVGEVCAQALYRGQALVSRHPSTRAIFLAAAVEETDHLTWLADRLKELKSRPSFLNPLWYAGAFGLGVLAGRAGDAVNLGFMAETEKQVEQHLDGHLQKLPVNDVRSRAIVTQMCEEERHHRETAQHAGGRPLPPLARAAMRAGSKVMTTTSYYI